MLVEVYKIGHSKNSEVKEDTWKCTCVAASGCKLARWEVIPTMVGQADMRIVNTAGNTNL